MVNISKDLKYVVLTLIVLSLIGQAQGKGMLTLRFDDGFGNVSTNVYPIMASRGLVGDAYITTDLIDTAGFMNVSQIQALQTNGWEIGSHTLSHDRFDTINCIQTSTELNSSKQILKAYNLILQSVAYPNGVISLCGNDYTQKDYIAGLLSNQNTTINSSEIDLSYLNYPSKAIGYESIESLKTWVNTTRTNNSWGILVMHDVNASGFLNTSSEGGQNFTALMDFVKSEVDAGNITVVNFSTGYYQYKNISLTVSTNQKMINPLTLGGVFDSVAANNNSLTQVDGYYNFHQDALENITVNITGINNTNPIPNPDFESWTTPSALTSWEKQGGVNSTNQSLDSINGTYSAEIRTNSSAAVTQSGIFQIFTYASAGYAVGDRLVAHGWFKNISNVSVARVTFMFYNGGAFVSETDYTLALNDSSLDDWQLLNAGGSAFVLPAGSDTLRIYIRANTYVGTNTSYRVDSFWMTKYDISSGNVYPTSFFNGTMGSTDVTISINGTQYQNPGQLYQGNNITFSPNLSILGDYGNISAISIRGSQFVNVSIRGDRVMNVKYGSLHQTANRTYTLFEHYNNQTLVEFWKNANIDMLTYVNYSIRSGVSGSIGTMTVTPLGGNVNLIASIWNTTGDYRKVFNLSASASVTAGGFAPNTNNWIYKNGVKWTILKSNSTGYISFSDTITSTTQYSTTSTTVQDAYTTSTCQSTLNWGVVGSALVVILVVIVAGSLAIGFLTGVKFDTIPIEQFVLALVGVVVVGSIGVAIINPIIILIGCP